MPKSHDTDPNTRKKFNEWCADRDKEDWKLEMRSIRRAIAKTGGLT